MLNLLILHAGARAAWSQRIDPDLHGASHAGTEAEDFQHCQPAGFLFPGEGRGPAAMSFERVDRPNQMRRNWAPAFAGEQEAVFP